MSFTDLFSDIPDIDYEYLDETTALAIKQQNTQKEKKKKSDPSDPFVDIDYDYVDKIVAWKETKQQNAKKIFKQENNDLNLIEIEFSEDDEDDNENAYKGPEIVIASDSDSDSELNPDVIKNSHKNVQVNLQDLLSFKNCGPSLKKRTIDEVEEEDFVEEDQQINKNIPDKIVEKSASDDDDFSNVVLGTPAIARLTDFVSTTAFNNKKPKKGTLVERLQSLIHDQVSSLCVWRQEMSQENYQGKTECIVLRIKHITQQFGKQIFDGIVMSDQHNLLDKFIRKIDPMSSSNDNATTSEDLIITVVTVPKIVGSIEIEGKNILQIYPPWEVFDSEKFIVSCVYFNAIADKNHEVKEKNVDEDIRVLKTFDCSCLRAKKLVDDCKSKFTNTKPNVIQYLFDH